MTYVIDIEQIAALPYTERATALLDKVRSYPFYVLYGLGFDLEFNFDNYIGHFGKPHFIVDRAKGGSVYNGVPVISSLAEVTEKDYCVIISAPVYAEEIYNICREYLDDEAIILYTGELCRTAPDYPQFLREHKDKIIAFYDSLADEESQRTLQTWLTARVTKDPNLFSSICIPNNYANASFLTERQQKYAGYKQILPLDYDRTRPYDAYFLTNLFEAEDNEVFYDIGAAYGDTVSAFFTCCRSTGKAVAVELDPQVAAKLEDLCREHGYNVRVENCGVTDKAGYVYAPASGNTGGTSLSAKNTEGQAVSLTTIDNLVRKTGLIPTLIKMDIEGAELQALRGATHTIKKHAPKLAICVYHKPQDIIEIPAYILSLCPHYRLYLRHFSNTASELVLFALRKE